MKPHLLLGVTLCTPFLSGQTSSCYDLTRLDGIVQSAITQLTLPGACLRVDQGGAKLYEKAFPGYSLGQTVPIASATKTLSAVVLLSLVDQGLVSLDAKVSTFLPSFQRPDKVGITLRQCFTHTAGFAANHPAISDDSITLAQAADQIATANLVYTPGTAFLYGGVSMQVAGRVCEVVGGKPWIQLFAERVATPLGLLATDYTAFGTLANPRIAGGARSSLGDFSRFMAMLADGGRSGATRVLAEATVAEMFRNQVAGLPVISTPHPYGAPYGIGIWLDHSDVQGRTLFVSAAGAFGFWGFVDLQRKASGALVVVDRFPNLVPFVDQIAAVVGEELEALSTTCVGSASRSCLGTVSCTSNGLPRSGATGFAVLGRNAPPSTLGALAFAAQADPVGTAFFDVRIHLPTTGLVTFAIGSDALGQVTTPVSLAGVPPGLRAAVQHIWLTTQSCGLPNSFFAASAALEIVTLAP